MTSRLRATAFSPSSTCTITGPEIIKSTKAVKTGDLAAIRDVGQNIRCFSRVYGFDELCALGEEIRCAADECSTLRIVHLQGQLADYLSRVEVSD